MFAAPRRLRWRFGGEVHGRRQVWRPRKLAVQTRSWMYSIPSMPRPPEIKVGAEGAISSRGSVFAFSTLREQQNNNRSKAPLPSNDSPPTQTPQGQPCSTGVGNNPLTIPEHSQRAVSRMPKARRSRLSLTRCAGWATFLHCLSASSTLREQQYNNRAKPRCLSKLQRVNPVRQGLHGNSIIFKSTQLP